MRLLFTPKKGLVSRWRVGGKLLAKVQRSANVSRLVWPGGQTLCTHRSRLDPTMGVVGAGLPAWTVGLVLPFALLGCAVDPEGEGSPASDPQRPSEPTLSEPIGGTPGGSPELPTAEEQAITEAVTQSCEPPGRIFSSVMYGPTFSRCVGCHNDFGLARQMNVGLRLRLPGEPGFGERNAELLRSYARTQVVVEEQSQSLLLAKATGQVAHVGGEVLAPGSAEAQLLSAYVDNLNDVAEECVQVAPDMAEDATRSLTLLGPRSTYARAKFALTGVVATPEELDGLEDSEAMLLQQVDALLQSPEFLARSGEIFADWLLTDAYTTEVLGNNLMQQLRNYSRRDFFQPLCTEERDFRCCDVEQEDCCSEFFDADYCDGADDVAINSVAREPVELIKHIVRNELPLTEIAQADYTVVNPYTATIYGMTEAQKSQLFDDDPANDAEEFVPAQVSATALNNLRQGEDSGYPHAGVLTTPVLLVRFPSSDSNQQRGRGARVVLERLLAVPIMKFSEFTTAVVPPDADLELATQQFPACTVCHAAIDPIAAHFKDFRRAGDFRPDTRLPEHLPEPAFLDSTMEDQGGAEEPLQWLGRQVALHDRFPLGVIAPVFADLTGAEVLSAPTDMGAPDFEARHLAFRLQQLELQRLRRVLSGSGELRLAPLVRAIVTGPFFRATGAPADLTDVVAHALQLAGVGPGAVITPEQMARKIESITGMTYRSGLQPDGRDMFRSFRNYRFTFGGTDWDSVPSRYREPNAMATRIAMRTGNEVACLAVPQDFARIDREQRKLFRHVDIDTVPSSGGAELIRTDVRRLHRLILGEDLPMDHPEIDATYQLWVAAHETLIDEGEQSQRRRNTGLPFRCQAEESFALAPIPYPSDGYREVTEDPNYTIRPWMAVIAYLLADPRFFLQ